MEIKLVNNLDLSKCPHCSIDNPNLKAIHSFTTNNHTATHHRVWMVYVCARCGGAVMAFAKQDKGNVENYYPFSEEIDKTIPSPARDYLRQAKESIHSPAGAVMLCASAVDSMLKEKGYRRGFLNDRINKAAEEHLITKEMAQWAHEIRLDANESRHAEEKKPLPNEEDARRILDFALALAQFLFILPARVHGGLAEVEVKKTPEG